MICSRRLFRKHLKKTGMNERKDMELVLCHLLVALSHLQHLQDSVALSVNTFKNMS